MRLASFRVAGQEAFGLVRGRDVVLLTGLLPGIDSLADALRAQALPELAGIAARRTADYDRGELDWLPVLPRPGKLVCMGMNYRAHRHEMRELASEDAGVPTFFLRGPHALLAHGNSMLVPRVSPQLDFEGELAVVIGRLARHVSAGQALQYVAGYTAFIDGSVRDYQRQSTGAGKNFEATAPLGPTLTTADEIPDPQDLALLTTLNGAVMQDASTAQMLHSVAACISYVSSIMTLQPGDVLATGSPGGTGAGRNPPVWLRPGDRLELTIGPLDPLCVQVAAEAAP